MAISKEIQEKVFQNMLESMKANEENNLVQGIQQVGQSLGQLQQFLARYDENCSLIYSPVGMSGDSAQMAMILKKFGNQCADISKRCLSLSEFLEPAKSPLDEEPVRDPLEKEE